MHEALNKRLGALPDDTVTYVSLPASRRTASTLTRRLQPGHEYTKNDVKFAKSILQSEPVQKLQDFAENNRVTTGKFTIGDEKVRRVSSRRRVTRLTKCHNTEAQSIHATRGKSSVKIGSLGTVQRADIGM